MLVVLLMIGTTDGLGQEASPVATPVRFMPPRPAALRTGTCAVPGELIAPLEPLTLPRGARLGQASRALLVQGSQTEVSLPLSDLLSQPSLIEVRQEEPAAPLACGEIGGPFAAEGTVHIGLRPVADSGFSGIVHLTPTADGQATTVAVYVTAEVARGQNRRPTAPVRGTGGSIDRSTDGALAATPVP